MKRLGGLAALVCLAALLMLCIVVPAPGLVVTLVAGLFVVELDRSGKLIAVNLVRLASLALPNPTRQECADEWADHVLSVGEAGLRPLFAAMGIVLLGAPRIVLRARVGPVFGDYLFGVFCTLARLLGTRRESPVRVFLRTALFSFVLLGIPLESVVVVLRRQPASLLRTTVFALAMQAIGGFILGLPVLPWPSQASGVQFVVSMLPILVMIGFVRQSDLVLRLALHLLNGRPTRLLPVLQHLREQSNIEG